jgi:hypothetical protein
MRENAKNRKRGKRRRRRKTTVVFLQTRQRLWPEENDRKRYVRE